MLNLHGRAVIGRALDPLGARLARAGVNPDVVTVTGTLGVVAGSTTLVATGHLVLGPLVCTVFLLSDLLDGLVARHRGTASLWGAFLDSSLDRVADAAAFGSLAYFFFTRGQSPLIGAVALVCLVGGSVTSYVKARAEGLGLSADVGIAERAERLIIAGVAVLAQGLTGVPWLGPAGLWVLAVLSVVTVVQRFREVRRQTRLAAAGPPAPAPPAAAPTPAR